MGDTPLTEGRHASTVAQVLARERPVMVIDAFA
jgi:hypothetical protein